MPARKLVIATIVGVAVVGLGVTAFLVLPRLFTPAASPDTAAIADWDRGTAPPPSAVRAARLLASPKLAERRSALTPELNATLPAGGEPPVGSAVTLDSDGWRQQATSAVATAQLTVPGQPAERIVLGFRQISGKWLVTFQESAA